MSIKIDRRFPKFLACAIFSMMATTAANAAYVSGDIVGGTILSSGSIVKLDPTMQAITIGGDNFNTNNIYILNEKQNFTLTSDLALDFGMASVAAGTLVSSTYIFFDPLDTQTVSARLVFDAQVLGVLRNDGSLVATNFLGAANVTYLDPVAVGLEPGQDFMTLPTGNPNVLRVNFLQADTPGDSIRVITAGKASVQTAVPEPATWAMLLTGFGAIGATMRRRKGASSAALA